MKHKNHTIQKLQRASNALHYEVSMLRLTASALDSGIFGGSPSPIKNVLIESFAIHVRVLIEFFYRDKDKMDTILAKHFFCPTDEWMKRIRPLQSPVLVEAKKRADKLLSHLTYTRSEESLDKEWPATEIASELENVLNAFLQNVTKELLGSKWKTTCKS